MVALFNKPVYDGALPPALSIIYMAVWGTATCVAGLWIFTKYSKQFAYYV
jgi:ABC-type polysaccharide/polyol phosphate export permease